MKKVLTAETISQAQMENLLLECGIEVDLPILVDQPGEKARSFYPGPCYKPQSGPLGYAELRPFKRLIGPLEFKRRMKRRRNRFTLTIPSNETLATLAEVVEATRNGKLDPTQEGYHAFPSMHTGLEPQHIGFCDWLTYLPCLLSTPRGWKFEWVHGNCAVMFPTVVVVK